MEDTCVSFVILRNVKFITLSEEGVKREIQYVSWILPQFFNRISAWIHDNNRADYRHPHRSSKLRVAQKKRHNEKSEILVRNLRLDTMFIAWKNKTGKFVFVVLHSAEIGNLLHCQSIDSVKLKYRWKRRNKVRKGLKNVGNEYWNSSSNLIYKYRDNFWKMYTSWAWLGWRGSSWLLTFHCLTTS